MLKYLVKFVVFSLLYSPIAGIEREESADAFLPLASRHVQLQPLFNLAYGYLDFCEDTAAKFKASKDYNPVCDPSFATNIQSARNLVERLSRLDQGIETTEGILQHLLWERLQSLKRRADKFLESKVYYDQYHRRPPQYFIPTDPEKLAMLRVFQAQGKANCTRDIIFAQESINRYQFFNLLISQLFNMCDPKALTRKTKEYISCSRTLWPILLGETTDLSYPDFAALSMESEPEDLKWHKDNRYYEAHFEYLPYSITMMNWGRKNVTVLLSRYTIAQIDPEFAKRAGWDHIYPLPRPSWLYPETVVPAASSSTAPITMAAESGVSSRSSEKHEDLHVQPIEQKDQQTSRRRRAANNYVTRASASRSQLGSGRKDTEEQGATPGTAAQTSPPAASITTDAVTGVVAAGRVTTPSETPIALIVPEQTVQVNSVESSSSESLQDAGSTTTTATTTATPAAAASSSASTAKNLPQGLFREGSSNTSSANARDNRDADVLPLPPRGMRIFHSKMAPRLDKDNDNILGLLKGKAGKLVNTIFDYRLHGQGFNFGAFTSMWEHLNGPGSVRQSGSGSSHYALLNRDREEVGGTFAHGDGQEYNKKTVRYLRAALNAIGIVGDNKP